MRYDLDQLKDVAGDVADTVHGMVKHMSMQRRNDFEDDNDDIADFKRGQ